jgi:hypothetical protein
MLLCWTSSYPGGGSVGGEKASCCGLETELVLSACSPCEAPITLSRCKTGGLGIGACGLTTRSVLESSYAGRSSRCTLSMFTPDSAPPPRPSPTSAPSPEASPLSRATSTACRNRSLSLWKVVSKSKAPPSLNSIVSSSSACCAGMPPP